MCGFGLLLLFVWLFVWLFFFLMMWHGGLSAQARVSVGFGQLWFGFFRVLCGCMGDEMMLLL